MEHLPFPRGAQLSDDDYTPCVAESYDGSPFLTYPPQSRFAALYALFFKDDILHSAPLGSTYNHMLADLEVFAQTWCFFGLLNEIFGQYAPPETFIRVVDGKSLVTTVNLPTVITAWSSTLAQSQSDLHSIWEHSMKCIERVHTFLTGIDVQALTLDLTVMRPIAILAETLEVVVGCCCKGKWAKTNWGLLARSYEYFNRLLQNGWSQESLRLLEDSNFKSLATYHYLSRIRLGSRPNVPNHGSSVVPGHADDTSDANTFPKHTCDSEACAQKEVDIAAVHRSLESDNISLLDMTYFQKEQDSEIDVVSWDGEAHYIAISHVWAEGMGNSYANSLPTCQLEYVARMAKQLLSMQYGQKVPLLVWLDTLCCPAVSIDHKIICLSRMQAIYKNASHVLTISATLRDCNSLSIDDLEICARVVASPWMTRLWTLQEGALARNLWIGLEDKPRDLADVQSTLRRINKPSLAHWTVVLHFARPLRYLRTLILDKDKEDHSLSLVQLQAALKAREVKVATDEPLCLAICLGLAQNSVVANDPLTSMPAFWRLFASSTRQIPRDIIFAPGARVATPGFGWSPTSLLRIPSLPLKIHGAEDVGILTQDGLNLTMTGCRLVSVLPLSSDDRSIVDGVHHNALTYVNNRRSQPSHIFSEVLSHQVEFRHPRHGWFKLTTNRAVAGRIADQYLVTNALRASHGDAVVVFKHALSSLLCEPAGGADCVIGQIIEDRDGIKYFRCSASLKLNRLRHDDTMKLESAWMALQILTQSTNPDTLGPATDLLTLTFNPPLLDDVTKRVSETLAQKGQSIDPSQVCTSLLQIRMSEAWVVSEEFSAQQKWCVV